MKNMNADKYHAIQSLNFEQAKQILDSGEPAAFLDVRTEQEYIVEHAAGAALFPLDEISAETAAAAIPDRDTRVIVYCRTGRRSRMAAEALVDLGYRNVCDLGSLEGWPYERDFGT